jgi:hypothetical protein
MVHDKNTIVIAYYTKNTGYEEVIKNLVSSLNRFNLQYDITIADSKGKWELNCGLKPTIIKTAMEHFSEYHLLYLDADAVVQRPLPFQDLTTRLPGICHAYSKHKGKHVASGTIYLPNNLYSYELVQDWEELQKENPLVWDQEILQRALKDRVYLELGNEWAYINDKLTPLKQPIIIQHTQVSRTLKKTIK